MKTAAIIKIIIASVLIVILTSILIFGLVGKGFGMYTDYKLYSFGNTEVSTEGIKELNIGWISGSVKISTYSGSKIVISESSSSSLDDDDKLRYLVKDGVLYIKYWSPRGFFSFIRMFTPTKELTVFIPESQADLLEKLKVDAVSASTTIDKISASNIELNSVSGSIQATPIDSSNSISAGTVSGEIDINAVTDSVALNSVSGEIVYNGEAKKFSGNSVSGEINIDVSTCPEDIDAKTVSGGISLSIPDNNGFTANYSSVSGDFNCAFATENSKKKAVYKDGSAEFDFSTVSGGINIKKK